MFSRLGSFVSRFWALVILFWIALAVGVNYVAPKWDDVTHDGDLAYMPPQMPSVGGEDLLRRAFPADRAKSEFVMVVAREDGRFTKEDRQVAEDLAIDFHNLHGAYQLRRAEKLLADESSSPDNKQQAKAALAEARAAFERALEYNQDYTPALWNLGLVLEKLGDADEASINRDVAIQIDPSLENAEGIQPEGAGTIPIVDVWSYDRANDPEVSQMLDSRYKDRQARLVVVRISNEFMAVTNILHLKTVQDVVASVQESETFPAGLQIGLTGSAAIGGDMLASAAESLERTELVTILLVLAILALVYRAPLMVLIPLVAIVASVAVAVDVVAILTQVHTWGPEFSWWDFKIFTTTRIFVVVILFGAGTDYCLFLIARYKEELAEGHDKATAIRLALGNVGSALAASALTTIFGLGMMFFADFGKYRNSGPAIAVCLVVALFACLTLAPAMLRGFGSAVFWPFGIKQTKVGDDGLDRQGWFGSFWAWTARVITARPGLVLVGCVLVLLPFAIHGFGVKNFTYDLVNEMSPDRPSVEGTRLMQKFFPAGEVGPVTVLALRGGGDFESEEGLKRIRELTAAFEKMDGVANVRSLAQPLGRRKNARFDAKTEAAHKVDRVRKHYLAQGSEVAGDVARFDLVLDYDPFSPEAIAALDGINEQLNAMRKNPASLWFDSKTHPTTFYYTGTTAGVRDLKTVTQADQVLIQRLVVLAVLATLIVILRHPVICIYLVISVLFSYFVTLGAIEMIFSSIYGDAFHGLDWKVPLYLFVILIAVGEDYNIYLATRVFEEQAKHGKMEGLRRAVASTGGIITSCGVIMAGTFGSMLAGTLRGMLELGAALALGVVLDTFVVRPILVPAFLALVPERKNKSNPPDAAAPAESTAVPEPTAAPHKPPYSLKHTAATRRATQA
ncbi:MAG: MMPL family transporter [Pirellulales bacterium]|nr:MMPL family transporter [Pirellulales bacterium]